jgi:hypothetical protein
MLLSFLGVIRAQVKQRTFKARQASEIKCLYQNNEGWRQARLCALLRLFNDSFGPEAARRDPELEEILRNEFDPREPAGEPQYQELLRLLDEEIAYEQEQFQYAEKVNEQKAAIERDAALAPVGEVWNTMVRQEGALDRSIDRKVRILLALREDTRTGDHPALPTDQGDEAEIENVSQPVGINIPSEVPANEEAQRDVPLDKSEAAPAHHPLAPSSQRRGAVGLAPLPGKEGKGVVVLETLPGRHSSSVKKKSTNDARMSLKTKGRCGKLAAAAGMCMETKEIQAECGNVVEKKGI